MTREVVTRSKHTENSNSDGIEESPDFGSGLFRVWGPSAGDGKLKAMRIRQDV